MRVEGKSPNTLEAWNSVYVGAASKLNGEEHCIFIVFAT